MMQKAVVFLLTAITLTACGLERDVVIAHRGYWKCEAGGWSQNSAAALRAAFEQGLWGTEFDCRITADSVIVVNHDPVINGKRIETHRFADFGEDLLPNGERRPTLDEFLTVAEDYPDTHLIIELKPHRARGMEDLLIRETFALLKAHGLDDPDRVRFITFSPHVRRQVSRQHPEFIIRLVNLRYFSPGVCGRITDNPLK